MKKIMFIAVFTAVGFAMVSCDKENLESTVANDNKVEKVINDALAKQGDTIVSQNTTTVDPGPGDDVVIITPPKP